MGTNLDQRLEQWRHAGLIDAGTVEKIREFERARLSPARSRWPVTVALAAGGLMLTAGVLLFVAAHWADLSPAFRFAVLLAGLVACHAGAAAVTERFPPLATTLHAVGTAVLGAAIFLAGQTFHLQVEWPEGFLLWALGAWGAFALLRSWPQLLLAALLTPAWVVAEWVDHLGSRTQASLTTPAGGLLLLAVVYLLADRRRETSAGRVALAITGATALIPLTILVVFAAAELQIRGSVPGPATERGFWWAIALGGPLATGLWLRGREAWPALFAFGWVVAGVNLGRHPGVLAYLWAAAGAAGITAAGVYEANRRRINLGLAGFALTVVVFYFSSVLDKLGRATSLLAGGLLLLLLAWSLERLRRRLLARAANPDRP